MQAKQSTAASTARAPAAPGSKRKEPSLATSRPMTRRQRVTADDTAGAKTLFEDKAREEDTEYVPEEPAEPEPEEEFNEGNVVDDERPPCAAQDPRHRIFAPPNCAPHHAASPAHLNPLARRRFADAEPPAADPALLAELRTAETSDDAAAGDDYKPTKADEAEPAEEYDEGPVVDDERPPFDDDGLLASADPKLVREIAAAGDEAAAEAESPEDRDDADFQPGNDSEVEEEYDEGKVVDDERPPFADDEAPVAADPALLQELQEGGDDDAAGDDDYKPGHESDVDEEFQAD